MITDKDYDIAHEILVKTTSASSLRDPYAFIDWKTKIAEVLCEELKSEREAVQGLIDALNALAHPDGIIRGPLKDGPEMDELNAAMKNAKEAGI